MGYLKKSLKRDVGAVALALAVTAGVAVTAPAAQAAPTGIAPAAHSADITIPSQQDIDNAKANQSDKAGEISKIEGLIQQNNQNLDAAAADSFHANESYSVALTKMQQFQRDADSAKQKAQDASAAYDKAKQQMGQLAGSIYKSGGVDPTLQGLFGGTQAADQAGNFAVVSQSQSRTVANTQSSASTAKSLKDAADAATKAAADASAKADAAKVDAQKSLDSQNAALDKSKKDRETLVSQLADLKGTTAKLEDERITGLQQKAQEEKLAQMAQAAAQQQAQQQAAAQQKAWQAAEQQQPQVQAASQNEAPVAQQPPAQQPVAQQPPAQQQPPVQQPPAWQPPAVQPPSSGFDTSTMVNFAMSKVGGAYVWGGTGPGYDCSGLIYRAFQAAGMNIARGGTDQFWGAPTHVPFSQAQYGDILAFNWDGSMFTHVGIYLGNNMMVNALNPNQGILVVNLNSLYGLNLYPMAARY